MMVELSVVIPTLKRTEEVEAINFLKRDGFDDYEVLIQDESPVTKARNEGIRRAEARKIVFLDDDSRPRPGYLKRAAAMLDREMAVAGRTIHPQDDVFASDFTNHYEFWLGDSPSYVDYFWGCNAAIRKEVFEEVGLWDEAMEWGHEEKELAHRLTAVFDIYYDPELVVVHPYADSIPDYWRKQYRLERQSPYYWDKRDISRKKQVMKTVTFALSPREYLGRTPKVALTRSGATIAKTLGRLHGFLNHWT